MISDRHKDIFLYILQLVRHWKLFSVVWHRGQFQRSEISIARLEYFSCFLSSKFLCQRNSFWSFGR